MHLHGPTLPAIPALAALLLFGLPAVAAGREDTPPPAEAPATPAPGGFADSGVCATCHEEVADALQETTHGRTGVANRDGATLCQSCHGPGAAHAEEGDKSMIRNPETLKADKQAAICLSCHERGEPSEKLLARGTDFATCTSCHLKRKASLMRSAHMPMREGSLTCSSCHNPRPLRRAGPGPGN